MNAASRWTCRESINRTMSIILIWVAITVKYKEIPNYLELTFVWQAEWFNQVPSEPRLWIEITEHSEGLYVVNTDCVQSRRVEPGCFVVLTALQLSLTVFSRKRYWTGTVVPNTCGLTDLSAGSSIEARTASAAAISTCDVTNARRFSL